MENEADRNQAVEQESGRMSVLIKGMTMPMPEKCWDCRFMDLQTGKCYADGSVRGTAKGYKRPADCPLFPIPDHGDLIDRSKLKDEFIGDAFSGRGGFAVWSGDILSAPVVIPAERSEDE